MPRMYIPQNGDVRRKIFRIHPAWTTKADLFLRGIRERHSLTSELIFVHVRRTDYLRLVTEFWKVPAFDGKDVDKLISQTAAKRPNATFLVLGDDENWCRANIQFGPRVLMAPSMRRPELAFAVMSRCHGGIFTYGSFGQWAGILGGGQLTRLLPKVPKERLPDFLQNTDEADPNVKVVYHPVR